MNGWTAADHLDEVARCLSLADGAVDTDAETVWLLRAQVHATLATRVPDIQPEPPASREKRLDDLSSWIVAYLTSECDWADLDDGSDERLWLDRAIDALDMVPPLGSRLREWRTAAGIEQAGLAKTLGVTQQTISDWERGRSRPHVSRARALDDAFGLPAGTVLAYCLGVW